MSFINKLKPILNNNKRIDWHEYFMSIALLASIRSSCKRLQVGCVLTKNNRIISTGYNGFIKGFPHKSIVRDNHEQATVHAEQNAIADGAQRGINLDGCDAYITHFPCINCAKILAAAGIKGIKYHRDYRNDDLVKDILAESGLALEQL